MFNQNLCFDLTRIQGISTNNYSSEHESFFLLSSRGAPRFSASFTKVDNALDFRFGSLDNEALPKWGFIGATILFNMKMTFYPLSGCTTGENTTTTTTRHDCHANRYFLVTSVYSIKLYISSSI